MLFTSGDLGNGGTNCEPSRMVNVNHEFAQAVDPPTPVYKLAIPEHVISSGALSNVSEPFKWCVAHGSAVFLHAIPAIPAEPSYFCRSSWNQFCTLHRVRQHLRMNRSITYIYSQDTQVSYLQESGPASCLVTALAWAREDRFGCTHRICLSTTELCRYKTNP